jgi:nucleotidyltransferase substrate binding protein (TIGR01987 family)
MDLELRWKQRFLNYEKVFLQLTRFIEKEDLNEFEKQGLIKSFEYTYELAWNLMKDTLLYQGITEITGSRDAIRQSFNKGLIEDGESWMMMINDRVLTVHTYNEDTAQKIESRIYELYFQLFEKFHNKMHELL